jgi:hypothetical protein
MDTGRCICLGIYSLREVDVSELAKKFAGLRVVGMSGLNGIVEVSEVYQPTLVSDFFNFAATAWMLAAICRRC